MSPQKTVTIIGGGIAGLSSAVFLTEEGFKVTLIESSPKLGGRAYSFFDKEKNQFFDNGQHILAGWYKNTFEYLKLIGSYDKLNFQKSLEINFLNTDKDIFKLQCPDMTPPKNLIFGLLKFKAFGIKDKFALLVIRKLLNNPEKLNGKFENVSKLLKDLGQTENLMKYFWEPFILAVFNCGPEDVNAEIFLNVINKGFAEKSDSTLVIPDINLNELLIDGAVRYFNDRKVEVLLNKRVKKIEFSKELNETEPEFDDETDLKISGIILEDETVINSDFYISAVSFFDFKKLFDNKNYIKSGMKADQLKSSGIVSVHLFFDKVIPEEVIPDNSFGMTGLIGTTVQWIFKRGDRHLSLVISGADKLQISMMSKEEILELCRKDLSRTLNNFELLNIVDYKVIKEKRATFIPDENSKELRPDSISSAENFFIAGDWTNTGLPSTIESAVTSSRYIQRELANYKFSQVKGK